MSANNLTTPSTVMSSVMIELKLLVLPSLQQARLYLSACQHHVAIRPSTHFSCAIAPGSNICHFVASCNKAKLVALWPVVIKLVTSWPVVIKLVASWPVVIKLVALWPVVIKPLVLWSACCFVVLATIQALGLNNS